MYKRILVPTDFSPFSRLAEAEAIRLARISGGSITLLHVIDPYYERLPYLLASRINRAKLRKSVQDQMKKELRTLKDKGTSISTQIAHGSPSSEILRAADRIHADLIILGTHGRTGIEHILLGSVAEKVIRLSSCPVLTIRKSIPESVRDEL